MNQQESWREGMDSGLPKRVHLVEVGPRDGLQAESTFIPTDTKIELVNRLVGAGVRRIEAASFVSPKWIPQMADGAAVMAGIDREAGVSYAALTPNMRGLEAAIESKADEVVIFGAASEAFSLRNINCSITESIERFSPVARMAKTAGLRLRASISCSFGCPYQGPVSVDAVVDMVRRFRDLGCDEIDIADTIGVGTVHQVQRVVQAASREFPLASLAGHFHDTYGQALANIVGALQVGMSIFHASVGGLGGCPYAKGATGNVATEDLLYLLDGLGIETGIDLDAVVSIGDWVSQQMSRENGARAGKALIARRARN
ncbi:hydroxymethylglutaryl-CoA lyase [Paraburkholderia haematera]|uniref:3-hydroxy-3-isohexenylglutaryl-CoA/hydroxy-methylglutaryl-CoA lyase n=1 Tax=Paraburkholderia haematera TaxID=2793077 RepID=A0ABM8SVF0_9BURK|nr:hydroxymethylglutaryl-CoA lyase [Paraburkholderia haematera]CAE6836100.1 3-hydroxy-3-isohexenylglutaryl-CoA/hydroxy-methylglutaryl-CoA lyase [Paraburkholderia haematera]